MSRAALWFWSGVAFVVIDNVLCNLGYMNDKDGNFGGLVLLVCVLAAMISGAAESDRRDQERRDRLREKGIDPDE